MRAEARANDKVKVREHYDRMSPYYHSLWGDHIHHGYWIRGDESKETAQVQLIVHLAQVAATPAGAKILDVGCGFGASSIYLARKYGAEATGITNGPAFVRFLRAFNDMRAGFASGNFVYGLMVARKGEAPA